MSLINHKSYPFSALKTHRKSPQYDSTNVSLRGAGSANLVKIKIGECMAMTYPGQAALIIKSVA